MSESRRPAASRIDCRYCGAPVVIARTIAGHWRTFDPDELPATTPGIWAFRKGAGMVPTNDVRGHRPHVCLEYGLARHAVPEHLRDQA